MKTSIMRLSGALLCCAAVPVTAAKAQATQLQTFDLSAEPLPRALASFTRATGILVVADAALTRGKTSSAVKGRFTSEAALDVLLSGTGLRKKPDGRTGFVLVIDAPVLTPRTQSTAQVDTTPPEPEIIVYGRLARDTTRSIPQSIDVLDRDILRLPTSDTVGEALRFVPGASRDGSVLDAFGDTYLIRGFASNQTVNGIAANTLRQPRDTIAVERVEVLKGPASVLYGQLQPGAVVNIVTKQPRRTWQGEAVVNYGRYDDFRATLDLTGPITPGGDLRFRLTAAYDDADSFIDFWHRRHVFVAPVIAFDAGADTTITVEGLYSRNRLDGFFNGLPAEGTVLPNPDGSLARSRSLTDPTFRPSIRDNSDISARVEHRFSDRVTWRTAVSWTHERTDEEGVLGLLGWTDATKRSLRRAILSADVKGDTWTAHTDVATSFDTGTIGHELVTGGDYTWFDRNTLGGSSMFMRYLQG